MIECRKYSRRPGNKLIFHVNIIEFPIMVFATSSRWENSSLNKFMIAARVVLVYESAVGLRPLPLRPKRQINLPSFMN